MLGPGKQRMRLWRRASMCLASAAVVAVIATPEIASAANPTATSVSCTPASFYIGSATSCSATVSDIAEDAGDRTTPTGSVSFSSNPAGGGFSAASCALTTLNSTQAGCGVTYTPAQLGTIEVIGTYGATSNHTGSLQVTFVTVFDPGAGGTSGPGTTSLTANPICGTLRQRLKAAKRRGDTAKVRKLKRRLRRLGC